MISGCENEIVIVRPLGWVRLNAALAVGVACRLCRSRSLFRKSTLPPAGTITTRGANMPSFWSIAVVVGSASTPDRAGGLSSHTTALRMPPCGDRRRSSGFFSLPHTYWSIVTASFRSSGGVPLRTTVPLMVPAATSPGAVARPATSVSAARPSRIARNGVGALMPGPSVYARSTDPGPHVLIEPRGTLREPPVLPPLPGQTPVLDEQAVLELHDAIAEVVIAVVVADHHDGLAA